MEELRASGLRARWKITSLRASRAEGRALYLNGKSSALEVAECLICAWLNKYPAWEAEIMYKDTPISEPRGQR